MVEADLFHPDLATHFTLLSYRCKDETDFILKSFTMVTEMLEYNDEEIEDLFEENIPSKKSFTKALHSIIKNMQKLKF